jgi:hypothetical protein
MPLNRMPLNRMPLNRMFKGYFVKFFLLLLLLPLEQGFLLIRDANCLAQKDNVSASEVA